MLRIVNILLVVVALSLAVACGRQVTPEPTISGLSGQMAVKLTVAGTIDLTNVGYMVVINTSGVNPPGTPNYTDYLKHNFQAFSYSFVVGANSLQNLGSCGAAQLPLSAPALLQYFIVGQAQGLGCIFQSLPPTVVWIPSFGGQNNEFEIIFPRSALRFPPITGSPAPSSAPSATPSVTPTPSTTPSGGSPTPTPVASPTTAAQQTWYINFMTTDASGNALDQMGGLTQAGFSRFAINTAASVTNLQQNQEITPPANSSAAIISAEVDNFP